VLKLSVPIAKEDALPSAFVVWRGFKESIPKAAEFGYDGVELALHRADDVDSAMLDNLLDNNKLCVSAISTGQVFADGGLYLTHEDAAIRKQTVHILLELVELAGKYGQILNLGRVRGSISSKRSRDYFLENVRILCEAATKNGTTIVLEPVNRYEINFINNLDEGAELIRRSGLKNLKLMPDVFHMNIEDDCIYRSLERNSNYVHYVHLADSNRLAPGNGHLDFTEIFASLKKINYSGWVSAEVLPKPSPDEAAKQAATQLLSYIRKYNKLVCSSEKLSMKELLF